ncbi:MAG: type IV pilus assembly protein PilV, partial [Oceanospirillaceae bacterium]
MSRGVVQRGVSLIEVLITLLVVSIGLLGLASLQLKSMSLSSASNQRQQAINLAHDISDRIFVNGAGASAGLYTIAALGTGRPVAVNSVATSDRQHWSTIADLFRGDYTISDPQTSNDYTITICWRDKN